MKTQHLKALSMFEKTLSRSQNRNLKGVSVTSKWCNAHALGDFRAFLNFMNYGYRVKKLRSLPNKLPNEF